MRAWLPRVSFASGLLVLLIGLRGAVADDTSQHLITNLSPEAKPISEYFYTSQSVYDGQGNEIGDVNDVLLDPSGRVAAVIVGVGGFLGGGEKNLAVAFSAFEVVQKDLESRLVLNSPRRRLSWHRDSSSTGPSVVGSLPKQGSSTLRRRMNDPVSGPVHVPQDIASHRPAAFFLRSTSA